MDQVVEAPVPLGGQAQQRSQLQVSEVVSQNPNGAASQAPNVARKSYPLGGRKETL